MKRGQHRSYLLFDSVIEGLKRALLHRGVLFSDRTGVPVWGQVFLNKVISKGYKIGFIGILFTALLAGAGLFTHVRAASDRLSSYPQNPDYDPIPADIPVRPYDRYTLFRVMAMEGNVRIVRLYEETVDAVPNEVVGSGDSVETEAGGRVELSLGNGIFVRMDERSALDVVQLDPENQDNPVFLRVRYGQIFVDTQGIRNGGTVASYVRIDTSDGSIWVDPDSLVRVMSWDEGGTDIVVYFGRAVVANADGQITVFPGQGVLGLRADYLPSPRSIPVYTGDDFENWNRHRRMVLSGGYARGDLDTDLYYEGYELNRYGTWRTHPNYGRVWIPPVTDDWFPYVQGHWSWVSGVLVWVPYEPWGWVTHHYGFWVFDPIYHWLWVPHHHFSFAWVAWVSTGPYIGWCPLTLGYQPLTIAHLRFTTHFGFFSFTFMDGHHRPWIFVNRSHFHVHRAVPRIRVRPAHVDRAVVARAPLIRDVRHLDLVKEVVPLERVRRKGYDFVPGRSVAIRPRVRTASSFGRTIRTPSGQRRLQPKPVFRRDGASINTRRNRNLEPKPGDRALLRRGRTKPTSEVSTERPMTRERLSPVRRKDSTTIERDREGRLPWARSRESEPYRIYRGRTRTHESTRERERRSPGIRDFMNRLKERHERDIQRIAPSTPASRYTPLPSQRSQTSRPHLRTKPSPSLPRLNPGSRSDRYDRVSPRHGITRSSPSRSSRSSSPSRSFWSHETRSHGGAGVRRGSTPHPKSKSRSSRGHATRRRPKHD